MRKNGIESTGWRTAVAAVLGLALVGGPAAGQEGQVEADDFGLVNIAVQDTDLAQVLELLSIQTQKNIIASRNVSATISANLYDVTFYEALDAILGVNGFVWEEKGNFIYVYTADEKRAIDEANRQTASRTFELDYLAAVDALEFITPLLSPDGQAAGRGDVQAGFETSASDGGADSYSFATRLVVNDYEDNLDEISELLAEVDTPPQQVLVESTILQSALDEQNAFGVDFSVLGSIDFTDITNPLSGVNDLLAGNDSGNDTPGTASTGFQPGDNRARAVTSSVGQTPGSGGFKIGVIQNNVSVFLRLLDEVTDTTVLARPKIMCLNRQRAEVLVGARIGYLSTTATETTSTQTVEYLDTGIQLQFRPFISNNGMIRLELRPSVSEATLRTLTDQFGIAVTIPDENTNELTTNVRIQDGETLVLGGLYRESNASTRRQVPLLGDIPLIGAAFRGNEDQVARDEIIFMITPTIMEDEILWDIGDHAIAYSDEALIGAREGLLPFSRTRQTESWNTRAMDAFNRGDLDMAVNHVNNSLRLAPSQPEMIRFRQRVLGTAEEPFEFGLMERSFRREISGEMTPGLE